MKSFRFITVVSGLVLALAGCVPDGGGQAVSRNPSRPLTLPERVSAHNAAVANTLLNQVASACGGTSGQFNSRDNVDIAKAKKRFAPRWTVSMRRWQQYDLAKLHVKQKALVCRDKVFRQHVLIRMADLNDLAQATPALRSEAKDTGLAVAEPASFKAELTSYKSDLDRLIASVKSSYSSIAFDKGARQRNFDSWMNAFSRAAANFNGQAAMSRTYGGAGTPTYGAPVIASYSQSVAVAARMAAIQSTTGAQSTGGGSSGGAMIHLTEAPRKKCYDGDNTYYCDQEAAYMAANHPNKYYTPESCPRGAQRTLGGCIVLQSPDYSQKNPNPGPSCPDGGCAIPG